MHIPMIEYNRNSRKVLDLFSLEDIKLIQKTLDYNISGTKCIPCKKIFTAIQPQLSRELKIHVFYYGLKQAILKNIIIGYALKAGRTGGVYKLDTFIRSTNACSTLTQNCYNTLGNSLSKGSA